MWQKSMLQVIVCGIILICIAVKVLLPVIRFYNSFQKILKITDKIQEFMNKNSYIMEGKRVGKEKEKKDFSLLLDFSYELKEEVKRAINYYEQIPYYIAKFVKIQNMYNQLYELLSATNQFIWKIRCNL